MKVYVRGIPTIVAVDDFCPFYNIYGARDYNNVVLRPFFAGMSRDGSIWPMLMEKVWAKVNGNYEQIEGGNPIEAYDFIAGCPTTTYKTNKDVQGSGSVAFNIVKAALNNGLPVVSSCCKDEKKSSKNYIEKTLKLY